MKCRSIVHRRNRRRDMRTRDDLVRRLRGSHAALTRVARGSAARGQLHHRSRIYYEMHQHSRFDCDTATLRPSLNALSQLLGVPASLPKGHQDEAQTEHRHRRAAHPQWGPMARHQSPRTSARGWSQHAKMCLLRPEHSFNTQWRARWRSTAGHDMVRAPKLADV